uniref:Flavodoxin-like domain-containing protein n=1 Tax=Palpitomonas bilix TaxID=652834 RepID=A0A7S3GM92_9EUKA|eukprot:CAMPEP_0113868808 /NCGR_PEP_ID=MMETSP0780_2-20120614/1195_1 /TAXON_ID=652834 /ORGANISM="Palpitomonas bilix" /LENGTH=203 /DNA_ID=CAMNT_0000853933 /DNA_START=24 /DNA_END=635 /DNA_ORIENTATION=- /assembly_acc=CAM_ASM_000599
MTKVYVVFFSKKGRLFPLAKAIVEGAKQVEGVDVELFRIADHGEEDASTFDPEIFKTPIIEPSKLAEADGVILGSPARQGHISSQVTAFLDGVAKNGDLAGRVGSAFTTTGGKGRGYGGHESIFTSFHATFLQLGMIVAGIPPSEVMDKAALASPYGCVERCGDESSGDSSDAGLDEDELKLAHDQGRHVSEIAKRIYNAKSN